MIGIPEGITAPDVITHRRPQQSDGEAFVLYCSGGLCAIQHDKDCWFIEPVLDAGPSAKGIFSTPQVRAFCEQSGFRVIAFHRIGWRNGGRYSSWSPVVPGRQNHMIGPANIWSQIAGNLMRARTSSEIGALENPSYQQIAEKVDARGEIERLAQSISLSLRNMDMSVEQIAKFYNDELADCMSSGFLNGQHSATTRSQILYAHVHSFFMHLGAARDYLATLIGYRLGKDLQNKDSLARLVDVLVIDDCTKDDLLGILARHGYLRKKPTSAAKVELDGWLARVTDLRNLLIHKRPYGARFAERSGQAVAVDASNGLYRYTRPIVLDDGEYDVLDILLQHYQTACALFFECAEQSGLDTAMFAITDADIVSDDIRN